MGRRIFIGLSTYRGKNAANHLEARRKSDGKIAIKLPDTPGAASPGDLTVVNVFKHLGGHINVDDGVGNEPAYRSSSAMQAYASLANRVFGSPLIDTHISRRRTPHHL